MAVLFAAGEPVAASRLAESLQVDESEIHRECEALISALSYHRSGIRIVKLEDAYQMCSSAEMAEYVTKTLETRKPPKLSPSQLETLTVIAYYQPESLYRDDPRRRQRLFRQRPADQEAHPRMRPPERPRPPDFVRNDAGLSPHLRP